MARYPRHQAVISRHSDENIEEDHWLNQFQKNLQKSAVQPRTQDSLFDQINSIMNGNTKSKYQSVEAAVEDMKARSGLTDYLSKIKVASEAQDVPSTEELVDLKQNVVKRNTEIDDSIALTDQLKERVKKQDWYTVGFLQGKHDKKYGKASNAVKAIHTLKYHGDPNMIPPLDKWVHFTMGYADGVNLPGIEFKKEMNLTRDTVAKIKMNKRAFSDNNSAIDKKVDITPIVIKKHPQIKQTLENYIQDTKGNLPVPAIIEKIRSIHTSDCSDAKDWDDDNLIRLVSKLNLGAKSINPTSYENHNNLGTRDSDLEIDPSNTDAFFGLNPVKM